MSAEPNIHVEVERRSERLKTEAAPSGERHPNTCPECNSHYRDEELSAALRVCPTCGHHFPVGALERIGQLVDQDTFRETASEVRSADPLAFVDLKPYVDRLAAAESSTGLDDAIVVGSASIDGHPCVLAVMDFTFLGGSMGSAVGEKFARACDLAIDIGVPLVSVTASGGARMQENILALMQMAKTTAGVDALQEAGLAYVSVLAHPTTGGVMASFAALGDVILAEPNALMSFTGPRVVQQTTGETLPEDFGRAEANFRDGHVDQVVVRGELRATLSRLLGLLAGGVVELAAPEAETEEERRAVRRFLKRFRLRRHGSASSNGAAA
jgi:acetyl-CoA carboxylase carboxyl transferase subunit beta